MTYGEAKRRDWRHNDRPDRPHAAKPRLTHAQYARRQTLAVSCAAWHVNYGGGCLNCGWEPGLIDR